MTADIQALTDALSAGNYHSGIGSLTTGAALQIEDLDVTLNLVTFICPQYITTKQLNRFMRRLNDRKIEYTLKTCKIRHIMGHNRELTVDGRTLLFIDLGK